MVSGLIAHVGADTSNLGVVGPVFDDLRFEFIPLKSSSLGEEDTYAFIKARNKKYGEFLSDFLPSNLAKCIVHCDPEFEGPTFGQPNNDSSKVKALQKLHEDDFLFFLASLVPYDPRAYRERRYFLKSYQREKKNKYIIGFFKVQGVASVKVKPGSPEERMKDRIEIRPIAGYVDKELVRKNEHFKRLKISDSNDFTLVAGFHDKSFLIPKAVKLTEKYEYGSFVLNALGQRIFNRITDTLRGVRKINEEAVRLLLQEIKRTNPEIEFPPNL